MQANNIEYQENFKAVQRSVNSAQQRCRMSYDAVHDDEVLLSHSVQVLDLRNL